MKKHLTIYLALFIVLIGCGKEDLDPIPEEPIVIPVVSIELSETSKTLKVDEEFTITVKINPENTTEPKTVVWETSNALIATVDKGTVKAINLGDATITAKVGSKTATCKVTVSATDVTGIALSETEKDMHIGDEFKLTATIEPADATNKSVLWASSDESIATVEDGNVIGLSVGEAVITATSEDGEFSATCKIGVLPINVTGIDFYTKSISLMEGTATYVSAYVIPENATNQNITYASSDESVFTVDQYGLVRGVSEGFALLQATSKEGDFSVTCEVYVTSYIPDFRLSYEMGSANFLPNGYVECGSCNISIMNTGTKPARIKNFYILDSAGYMAYAITVDRTLEVNGGVKISRVSFGVTHRPRVVFEVDVDGKEHIIEKGFMN